MSKQPLIDMKFITLYEYAIITPYIWFPEIQFHGIVLNFMKKRQPVYHWMTKNRTVHNMIHCLKTVTKNTVSYMGGEWFKYQMESANSKKKKHKIVFGFMRRKKCSVKDITLKIFAS